MRKLLGILAVSTLAAACTPDGGRGPATTAANAPRVEAYVPPKPGTRLVHRIVNDRGSTTEVTRVVAEITHQGKPALAYMTLDRSHAILYDPSNRHWVGNIGRNGNMLTETSPPSQNYQWPLVVGASWSSSVTFHDRVAGRSWSPLVNFWAVEAVEDVTVPAGTFHTFRLQSRPGQNSSLSETVWYAPDLGTFVRSISTTRADSYVGAGRTEIVLVSFQAPTVR